MKRISLHKVMAKLAEEQQPQEINLSSVQEAEALIKEMSKLEQELKSAAQELQKYESTFKQYKKEMDDYKSKEKEYGDLTQQYIDIKKGGGALSMNTIDELEKKAQELGMTANDIPVIDKADRAFEALADAVRPVMNLRESIYMLLNK